MKSILDPSFRYTPSGATDIRKTFARLRLEQRRDNERLTPSATPAVGHAFGPRLALRSMPSRRATGARR